MHTQKGFTLIELLVVIAIISILAVIVVPSYQNYVLRGKVPDALGILAAKRVQMEQSYQDNRTYAGANACSADSTTSKYFNFSGVCDARSYTITATGKGSMVGFVYTINQLNSKTSTISTPAPSGWQAVSTSCWITKQGGGC